MRSVQKRNFNLAIILVVLIAFALRMFLIDNQELRGDEAFSWVYVSEEPDLVAVTARIVREGESPPPLHYWLLQAWVRLFGESEFALRSISAFLSVLLVPLMAQLARKVLGQGSNVVLIVAVLTALHPYQIWLAQDVRNMYPLALAFLLIATWQLPGLIRGSRRSWIFYVMSGALAMYSHYYAVFGLSAHVAYVALSHPDKRATKRWLAAGGVIALTLVPWMLIILPAYASTGEFFAPTLYPFANYFLQTVGDAALGPSIADTTALFAAAIASVAIVVGLRDLWASRRAWAAMFVVWLLVAFIGIYVVLIVRPTFNSFYFILAFPPVYILFATALDALWRQRRRVSAFALGVLTIFAFAVALRNHYFEPAWSKTRGMREVADFLSRETRMGDVLINNVADPAIDYYLRDLDMPSTLLPPVPDFDADEVNRTIDALATQYGRMWAMPVTVDFWDADGFVEAQLSDRYISAVDYQFHKVRLRQFVSDPQQLPEYHALDVRWADGITLTGAYVTVNGDPTDTNPDPGEWLRVTLLWTTQEDIARDYTVFVHALNADGQLIDQHDGMPHNGFAPTSSWTPNALILDVHEFQIQPDRPQGQIVVNVGLYDAATGERLPMLNGDDSLIIWPRG